VSIFDYYWTAIVRSFWNGWDWAVGQGILLGLVEAIAAIILGVIAVSFLRKHQGTRWRSALRIIRDTLVVIAVLFVVLFLIFFVQDAPNEIAKRDERIAQLGGAPDANIIVSRHLQADAEAMGKALRELSNIFNKDIAEICGERLRRMRLCVQLINTLPMGDCAARALEQFQSERPILEKLLGTSRDTGLLNAGEPEIIQILNQAVQRKDRQIIIDFDDYSRRLYSAFRFFNSIQALASIQGDEKQPLFDMGMNITDGDVNRWDEAAGRYCGFVQKTNQRISWIRDALR
jgi:hypothetical protein